MVLIGQALWQNLDLDHDLIQLRVQHVDVGKAVVCWLVWVCQFVMEDRSLWTVLKPDTVMLGRMQRKKVMRKF